MSYIKGEIEEFLNCNPSGFTGIERIPFKSILDDLLAFAKKKADEEKKYFTPTIEDLHVGYEAEFNWCTSGGFVTFNDDNTPDIMIEPTTKHWETIRCGYPQTIMDSSRTPADFYSILKNGRLRTPYLTTEQIEKEGWKYEPVIGLVIAHKFTKGNYILYWFWSDKKIFIYKMKKLWPGSVNYGLEPLYKGICPSINEFRTIMKLLNIK